MITDQSAGARILRGERNWWFLGPGGVARLSARHLTADGALRPAVEQRLRDSGLCSGPRRSSYSLTVLTSTDCNLGCGYCFQNTGQDPRGGTRPPRIAHARLTSAAVTEILEFSARQMALSGLDKLSILLFGGEPLLNVRGCAELLARAADYGLASAWMISNATLLTPPVAARLAGLGLRSIQVTFDGDRDVHDQIRVRRSAGGTFDAIIANLAAASAASPLRWILRVNVSHRNYQGIGSLVDRLAASLDPARCTIYFAPVGDVGVGYANDLAWDSAMSSRFARWQRQAIDLGFKVSRPRAATPCATCGHGDGRYGAVVNANGTLSSCWETAGQPGWEVGTVTGGYLPAEGIRDRWVGCGDLYRHSADAGTLAAFQDAVDADLLDYLDQTNRL